MAEKLNEGEIGNRLAATPGWQAVGDQAIVRNFVLRDHIEAIGLVVRIGMAAEVLNHHPELHIVYNRVDVRLSTHDAGGVTVKDFELAARINALG